MKYYKFIPIFTCIIIFPFSASVVTAENMSNAELQQKVKELTAELEKYKAAGARVKYNLSLMTKADVSMNARNWKGFNEVHSDDVFVTTPDMPVPTKNKSDHLDVVKSFTNAFLFLIIR